MVEFHFDREDISNLAKKEWLVTNGLGGFASGTVAGLLTRQYHGLLVAALNPPVERIYTVAKFDPWIHHNSKTYSLFANQWNSSLNPIEPPNGMEPLRKFSLDGSIPTWEYHLDESVLLQQIWMAYGENTTYIRFSYPQGEGDISMTLKGMLSYSNFHQTNSKGENYRVDPVTNGVKVMVEENEAPYYLLSETAMPRILQNIWLPGFYLAAEDYRGLDNLVDLYNGVDFRSELAPGEEVTMVITLNEDADLNGYDAYFRRKSLENQLLERGNMEHAPERIKQLILSADQFIVWREVMGEPGHSVIAGYPWFSDWGRDTMIALPGLTLATGRYDIAESILRTYAKFVDQGMLPNRFPDVGEQPVYNTIDASLWYFEAVYHFYLRVKEKNIHQAENLVRDLYPVLESMIRWHIKGTRFNIHMDPEDHLIYGGEHGVQLTWMDAKIGDFVVTLRIGKPIEVNALWYSALRIMSQFSVLVGEQNSYDALAAYVKASFQRFWIESKGYCIDVLDGPDGDDDTLRPNQVIAGAVAFSPLEAEQIEALLSVCEKDLLTPFGLRSLDPASSKYRGVYGGDVWARDTAYHQGTVWGWLIGPYLIAKYKASKDSKLVEDKLDLFLQGIDMHGVGSISEIFDGDAPNTPRGCIAQAWSVAAGLQVWDTIKGDKST